MPKRVQINWRKRGGKRPPGVRSVARPTRMGNPYKIGDQGVPDAATAVRLFEEWITGDSISARMTRGEAQATIRGFDLACYCPLDQPCHADVLLKIANVKEPKA